MKKGDKKVIIGLLIMFAFFASVYIFGADKVDNFLDIDSKEIAYDTADELGKEFGFDVKENVQGDLKIYYFYVGQADCTLIMCDGETMLIDAGNNKDGKFIVKKLKELGIEKINYLVATHAHEDHIGGIDNIIKNFKIGKFFMPTKTTNTPTYEDIIKVLEDKNMKFSAPKVGYTFSVGSAKCEVMGIDNESDALNENSIIIELTHGDNKFLFMGDAEIINEQKRTWNDVDVLKVGHHGSSSSTGDEFLEQVKPEYVVISCGINNDYGHPHKETLAKLKGLDVYRTDKDGTILITSDGSDIKVEKLKIDLDGNKE